MSNQHDPVNHPKHYTSHPSGVECITITRHMSFNLGNAIKYIWRVDSGKPENIQDLQKAIWYLNNEISRLIEAGKFEQGSVEPETRGVFTPLARVKINP